MSRAYAYKKAKGLVAPPPPPPPPVSEPVPTASNTKAQILEWLSRNGVDIDDPALTRLTKDELLALVADTVDIP